MFGYVIREIRKRKQITQSEMAEALNVAQGTIANWESGIRSPSIDILPAIARYLDVSIDTLLGMNHSVYNILTNDESALLEEYRAASKEAQISAHMLLKAYPKEEQEKSRA